MCKSYLNVALILIGINNYHNEIVPLDETYLDVVRGLIQLKGFIQCVNKENWLKRRKYVRAEQADLLYANTKDLKVEELRLEVPLYL